MIHCSIGLLLIRLFHQIRQISTACHCVAFVVFVHPDNYLHSSESADSKEVNFFTVKLPLCASSFVAGVFAVSELTKVWLAAGRDRVGHQFQTLTWTPEVPAHLQVFTTQILTAVHLSRMTHLHR